jgi:hypothetical protein
MDETPTPPPLALQVVGGGEPTPEELAAVLVALTPAGGDGGGDGGPTTPAWTRAAMLEGVGGRPAASPADLATSLPLA